MSRSILWFRQDLRLHDNEALCEALVHADEVIPVYIFDRKPNRMGPARTQFLLESVRDLRRSLKSMGSDLIVRSGPPDEMLYRLAMETRSHWVYCNRERTSEEIEVQDKLEQKLWTIGCELRYTRGKMLFHTADLPFPVTQCPDAFAQFRKAVDHITPVRLPLAIPERIPALPKEIDPGEIPSFGLIDSGLASKADTHFTGGESEGLKALGRIDLDRISSVVPDEGTALSPWIAMGSLSPKKVYATSFQMEDGGERVRQNLIYRDYLRLMGKKYGDRIFYKSGIYGKSVSFERDQQAFEKWKAGQTGVPIIDAAMHQLFQTGWIPDVLRRMVAGYLVKVLRQDWRMGASWFEYALIDYDPCSNWVSWMNIAGLGPDTRDDRIIHYEAAGKKLDPDGSYVMTWNT